MKDLLEIAKNTQNCTETVELVLEYYYPEYPDIGEKLIVKEEYEDYAQPEESYSDYVIRLVEEIISKEGLCGIHLSNYNGDFSTFDHSFVLIQTEEGIVRMESYVGLYCSRILPNKNYKQMLRLLIDVVPGEDRLNTWNQIFWSHETQDNDEYPLDVEIFKTWQDD